MKFIYQLSFFGLFFFFLFIETSILNAQVPNNQDCLGAIPVCQNSYHQGNSYSGTGNYPAEIPTTGGCPGNCMLAGERNDVWYTFTVQNSGWLNFSIDPVSSSDDYDWALYNLTTDNCSSILNLAAAPYLQVSCNWSADPGLTGANSLSPNTGGSCGGASDAQNNVQVWVNSGQTFYLNISNYSSTQYGYDLDFDASTAQLYDNIPPYLLSFIYPVCGATSISVTFSENVLCSTVQPGDFTITGPGGISVTSVYGAACAVGGTNENTFTLNLSSSLQIGTYTLCLNGSAGNVSDNCGNMSDPSNPLNCKTFTISGSSVTVSPSSASLCSGQSVSLSASGAANFSWAPSAGLSCTNCPNPTANPNSTTTYTVSGVTGSCNNGNATVTINVSPNPSVSINSTPSPLVVCSGDSISLTANSSISGSTYQWSTGQTSQTISGIPPVSDTLYVTVTTPASCSASASIIYTENPTPFLNVSAVPSAICYGQSSTLTASGAASYNWQPGNLNGAVVNVTPNSTTTYTVTGTSTSGCSSSATVTVTVNANPVVFASSSSTVICSGQCTNLDASGAATYTWQPGNLSGASVNVCPVSTTTYTLTGSTAAGCTNTSSIIITVNPTPVLNASATPNTLCNGQCTNLNASGASSYTWQPGNLSGSTVNVCPNNTTTYTLTGSSAASCSSTANVNVTVNPLPTVNISSATNVLCNGQCTNLNASGASTYIWQPGNLSGSTINACPATSVIYTLTGTNAYNCSSTDTIAITVNPNPILTVTPSTSTVCLNDCSQLTAGGAITYSWAGAGVSPASGAIVNACPSSTTIYTITGTNSYNCTSSITATVNVNPNLNITVSPNGTAICTGDSALLTLSPAATYTWTPSISISSAGGNSFYAFPVSTTTYYINGVNSYGCSGSDTIVITVNQIPTSDFTVTSPVCNPDSSYFEYTGTAGSGATFNWSFNSGNAIPAGGFQDYYVQWANPGFYQTTLIVTENNCTSPATNNTVVISSINAAVSVLNNVSCNGLSDGLATVNTTDGIPPYIFYWNTIPPQNTQQADSLAAGSYIVTVGDSAGCISTDTVIISEPLVLIADTISLQNVNCFGGNNGNINATANGGTPPYSYNWSNGASGSNNNNLIAGNYTLTVTDNNNCTATLQVSIYEPPKLNLLLDVINESCENYCDGSVIVHVSGGTLPYQYQWNPASGNDSIADALCNGFYSVTVTDNHLCQADTQCQIITMNTMFANASADPDHSSINIPVNFYFTGTPANVYHWNFGDGSVSNDQNPVHTYMADGTYTVILTVSSGAPYYCEDVFILTIIVYTPSSLEIPNLFTPNGDGYNDVFKLKSFGLKTEVMSIYNRWGKKIYEWNEPGGQWDGTTEHGAKCSDGTYYYILKASGYDGLEYNFEGTITLIK